MSWDRFGHLSESHARADVDRRRERAQNIHRGRTLAHDFENLVMMLPRLARRLRRALRR
jgi:hypothetical protein